MNQMELYFMLQNIGAFMGFGVFVIVIIVFLVKEIFGKEDKN